MATPAKPRAAKAEPAPTAAPAGTNHPVIKDKKIIAAAEEYATLKKDASRIERRLKELKPVLEAAMDGAPVAYAGARILNLSVTEATPEGQNQVITREMIGQVIPGKAGRAGYTTLAVQ
ncbi:hypothetical protein [Roseomonas marmotae]|uniref:Uncharacterized protein n=1 Tax=Roseomonas marmotae TaxID=2768161 RepID=A0ABS3KIE8_9PROT|nr:hypothetical protein [Roseomonas marmotae]MBO1077243.1 hypothetical protein [Roseomonas marmotae]QTI81079.1 hypothetical protein IAI58_17035 [Roseomonas marmotae]